MMGIYTLATLVSVWLVCTGAHIINKRQEEYTSLHFCVDTAFDIVANSALLVESPNNGYDSYQNNTRCNLVLRSGNEPLYLFVIFEVFDVEYQRYCEYDSLCLGGYKFCGKWAQNTRYSFILPANKNFTLDFKSDDSVTGGGFLVTIYTTLNDFGSNFLTPVRGVGSNEKNLKLDYVSYSNDYSNAYRDKCSEDNNDGNPAGKK